MTGAHKDGVDRVAACSGQMVSLKKAVAFGVTDDRFDGAAPSQFAFDGRCPFGRALRHVNIGRGKPVAAIISALSPPKTPPRLYESYTGKWVTM